MKQLFDDASVHCSKLITRKYSTSFSIGIFFLHKSIRNPIYSLYGFVRLADEIVDSFHGFDKKTLLEEFKKETFTAIERGISLNPVLNSFQEVVNHYQIDHALIVQFLKSMEMDLQKQDYSQNTYEEYILGSAEVVGLMCLKVFTNGDEQEYQRLKPTAMKLGVAFQKINFLRDLRADYFDLGRVYFPNIDMNQFGEKEKQAIEMDIQKDFDDALVGIRQLPFNSRFGVYVSYIYYCGLFKKIKSLNNLDIMKKRIRISNSKKMLLVFNSYVKYRLNII